MTDWWEAAPRVEEEGQWWAAAPVVSPAPRRESHIETLWRTYGGAVGDTLDAAAGIVNNPLNAVLRQAGVDYQIPTRQAGGRIEAPARGSGRFIRGALPYVGGTAGVARGATALGVRGSALATSALSGAVTDTALSSVNDANLSNLIDDYTGVRLPTARVEGENPGAAALKDTVEGLALGGAIDLGVRGVRGVSDFVTRAFTDPVAPPRAAGSAVEPVPGAAAADGADDAARAAGGAPEPPADTFDIVRTVERGGFWAERGREVSERGIFGAVSDWTSRLYTAGVAEQHPLARTVERLRSETEALTGRPVDIAPGSDPRKLARGGYDVFSIGHMDVTQGVHGYRRLAAESPALGDVVAAVTARASRGGRTAEASLAEFDRYIAARRATQEWDRFARGEITAEPISIPKDQTDAFIARMEAEHPEFMELAEATNSYAQALWKKQYEAGLVAKADYEAALAARDFYVPLNRVMDDGPARRGSGASNRGPAAKKFKGSQRDIEGPLETLVRRTYEVNRRIRQNDINRSLVDMAERLNKLVKAAAPGAANGVLRKVKTPRRKIDVGADDLKAFAKDRNAADSLDDLFGEDSAAVWRAGDINEGGRPIIYVWRDGKREAWEFIDADWGRETFEAVTGMSREMSDMFGNLLAVPSQVLRAGITTNPEFLVVNYVRDQMAAWVLTDVGLRPGLDAAIGMVDEVRGADSARLYNLAGGISGGSMTAATREVAQKADVMKLARKGYAAQTFSDIPSFLRTAELSETGTRIGLFKRAFERAKKEGLPEYDALVEAAFTARDFIDFGRNGSRMAFTRKVITFLNATIQGLDKTVRVLGADPAAAVGRVGLREALRPVFGLQPVAAMRREDAKALRLAGKAWTKVSAMTVFGLALTAAYRDDEWYQGLSEYTRTNNWAFMWGGRVVLIPKPFDLALPSTIAERVFEAVNYDDPTAWERLVRGVAETLALPTDTPALKVPTELATNTNLRTGGNIVPEERLDDLPQDQFNNWSSSFSMGLGQALGVSPAQIDHVLAGFAGSWGRWFMAATNLTDPDRPAGQLSDMPLSRRFFTESTRGSQDKTAFYDRVGSRRSELNQYVNSIRERMETGRASEAQALLGDLDDSSRLYVQSQLVGLDENGAAAQRRLHPLARARTVNLEVSRVIGEFMRGRPKDQGEPLPVLNGQQKAMLTDALERLAVAEMRNAMIVTRQPGYENRSMIDRHSYMEDVRDISPEVADELERRLTVGRDRAYSYDVIMELWPRVESRLNEYGSDADMLDLSSEAMARSGF